MFEHIAARDTALPKVCEWLTPGGCLVLEDAAFFTAVSSGDGVYAAALQAAWDLLARTGTDYACARTFPTPLVRCGLKGVGVDVSLDVVRGKSPLAEFWSLGLQALGPRMIEADLLSADALDHALALLADPDFWDCHQLCTAHGDVAPSSQVARCALWNRDPEHRALRVPLGASLAVNVPSRDACFDKCGGLWLTRGAHTP